MIKSSYQHNLNSLIHIANRLDDLCNEITFVGGCIAGLLITDKAAPDVRSTLDVAGIINVLSKQAYHAFSEKLRKKQLKELSIGNGPICRWDCDGILIDVMPIDENILGFTNKWYKDAEANALNKNLDGIKTIKIISAPYFIATKLEAFKDRGKQDYFTSHDLEDIIALLDGRSEIVNEISHTENKLRKYLSIELHTLINNFEFMKALPGHLNYSSEAEERKKIVEERIYAIIGLGK